MLAVSALFLGSLAYQDTTNCGYQRVDLAPEFSITGGRFAQDGEWPWQVALLRNDGFLCGGQLIKEDWVLTASHCITHLNDPTSHRIMMGSTNLNNFTDEPHTQIRNVLEFYAHPQYSTLISDFDLALIQLQEPFDLDDYVTTICLARRGMESMYDAGTAVWVTGWGAKKDMGPLPKKLHEVEIPIVDHEQCHTMYLGEDNITSNMVCASPEDGGKGACAGDSGGPLVTKIGDKWWLAGTVLGGNGCGSPDFPSVYQNVIAFQDWIEPIFRGRHPESQTTQCTKDQFKCKEGWCLDYWRRCNVREDCQLGTDELYCERELKLFDIRFDRRLNRRTILRNVTVANSLECAQLCLRTISPMKCGAFDTRPSANNTRLCSLGSAAYTIQTIGVDEQERDPVSHFSFRFRPEPGSDPITEHIGMIMSPNSMGIRKTGQFFWVLNLDAPNSNTIVFTILSVRSSADTCDKVKNMAMLAVKPGGKGRRRNRKNRNKNKNKNGNGNGNGEDEEGLSFCLGELSEGDQFRIHTLQARVVFYTTHARRFAFTMDYKPEYNCTKTLKSGGRIRSPNYPNKYPPTLECQWTYRAPRGKIISVEMDDFFVEKVPECEYDYVEVYDGSTTEAPLIGEKRCGRDFGGPVRSTGNFLLIVFVSDSEVSKTGFQGRVSFERPRRPYSQRLVAGDGDVNSYAAAADSDSKVYLYSLWGTGAGALFVISVLSVVCYKLKKRLDATTALVRNIKRNNVVLDSH
ncbi:uncharacterized protein [Diadema antillarum]|uniref:uncharacterized protein n=1 Tax=Diadema antillarum TaxID=105358 RepID=UPI003A88BFA9